MSELKATRIKMVYDGEVYDDFGTEPFTQLYYRKSEADKVIADLEESHKKEVEQLLMEIAELKSRIAPKYSDKTLQERLNEVFEKHGVSTLQDLDWAFCESEKRRTRDSIESANMIAELKEKLDRYKIGWAKNDKIIAYLCAELNHNKHKRCLAMANLCHWKMGVFIYKKEKSDFYYRWHKRWLELAEKFKEVK